MKEIIEIWKKEAFGSLHETTAFHIDGDRIYIVTKYPGLFIGFHGKLYEKYKRKIDKEIIFVDLGAGNVKEF